MTIITDDKKSLYPDGTFVPHEVAPNSLILKITTQAGQIEGDAPFMRVPFVSDLPDAYVVDEGKPGQYSEPTFDEKLIETHKLIILSRQSREAASHQISATLLANSMGKAMTRKADNLFINGIANEEGTRTNEGLVDIAGTTATATLDTLDPIIDLITQIETKGGTPSDIVTDPQTWASILKLKASDGSNVPLLGSVGQVADRHLFNCRVHISPDMPAGTLIVLDKQTLLSVTGGIETAISDAVFFDADTIARRLTWRIGWGAVHPERIGKLTIEGAA